MPNIDTLVTDYVAAWNEHDPGRRRALVERTFSDNAVYLDPLMAGDGIEGIDAMLGAVQEQFPEHRLELVGTPDSHHDRLRFGWRFAAGDGAVAIDGLDCVLLSSSGKMANVTGFLANPRA
jgi:hypothetical protein